jgi:hypothetical protein
MSANLEYEKFQRRMEAQEKKRKHWMSRAEALAGELKLLDDTSIAAEFLANVCHPQDEKYGLGSQLCLEWMLEQYMAREVEKAYPWIQQIHKYLVDNGHSNRNKLEYFNDCEAYFLKEDRIVMVFGKFYRDDFRYLVTDKLCLNELPDHLNIDFFRHQLHVRKVWRRTGKSKYGSVFHPTVSHYSPCDFDLSEYSEHNDFHIYGDLRDIGHVLSYEKAYGKSKCDGAAGFIPETIRFLFEVNTLWTQTVGEQK